jgi:hypothetical protein
MNSVAKLFRIAALITGLLARRGLRLLPIVAAL